MSDTDRPAPVRLFASSRRVAGFGRFTASRPAARPAWADEPPALGRSAVTPREEPTDRDG